MEPMTRETLGMNMTQIRRAGVELFLGCMERGILPLVMHVEGSPGIGKTYTVEDMARDIAKELKIPEVKVYAQLTSCLDPVDITGAPYAISIDGKDTYASYLPLEWAWECSVEYEQHMQKSDPNYKAPPAILFFDDISAAHFQTQTAFFKGVHEGMWGSLHQRHNVMVICAGNRVEDNAGANDMPTALANRMCVVHAKPTTSDWLKWGAGDGNIHPFVMGFIRQFNEHLSEFNTEVANSKEKAFASPRTWDMLSQFIWMGRISQDDPIFANLVMGWIGGAIGLKFLGYMRNTASCVSADDIFKDPEGAAVPTAKQLDALFATISSLEYRIKQEPFGFDPDKEEKKPAKKQRLPHWKAGLMYALRDGMLPEAATILAKSITMIVVTQIPPDQRSRVYNDPVYGSLWEKLEHVMETEV